MGIVVAGPIYTQKNIKDPMGQLYPYYTRWVENIATILHMYWVRAISLLFCDHKGTESE